MTANYFSFAGTIVSACSPILKLGNSEVQRLLLNQASEYADDGSLCRSTFLSLTLRGSAIPEQLFQYKATEIKAILFLSL